MTKWLSGPVVALCVLPALTLGLASSPAPQSVAAREIIVRPVDAGFEPALGLTAADFEVTAGGTITVIRAVTSMTQPVDVTLVIDGSSSTLESPLVGGQSRGRPAVDPLTVLRNGAGAIVGALTPADVLRASVVSDAPASIGVLPPTRGALDAIIRSARRDRSNLHEASPLWDAAAHAIGDRPTDARTRVVVIISDGRATGNFLTVEELRDLAVRHGVMVAAVCQGLPELIPQSRDDTHARDQEPAARLLPCRALEWLAGATGGVYIPDASARGQSPADNRPGWWVARVIAYARHGYRVTIDEPAVRSNVVTVTVKRPGIRIPG